MVNPVNPVVLGNTKTKTTRSRRWIFTINNYSEEEYIELKEKLHSNPVEKYIIGKEVGKQGTPHLQGYVYFKDTKTFQTVKAFIGDRAHLEMAKGKPADNFKYCSKDGDFVAHGFDEEKGFKEKAQEILCARRHALLARYDTVVWRGWQARVLETLSRQPDSRTIHWVFDPDGNSGKSFLTKYIYLTRPVIIADGKKDNIFNQVLGMLNGDEKKQILPQEPEVILLDIPRSSEGYINYGVLEQLKNGLIYSGKYEGGCAAFGDVHVIVFANFMPDMEAFSQDRWDIIRIN